MQMFILAASLLWCVVYATSMNSDCIVNSKVAREMSLSVLGKRNSSGDTVTFSATKNWKISSDDVRVDVKHRVVDCGDVQTIHIEGVIRGIGVEEHLGELIFHNKCGRSVAVINNGFSAQKIHAKEHFGGGLLTNRALKNNELFEVNLDKIFPPSGSSIAIGVTTQSPEEIEIPEDMNSLRPKTWMYYDGDLWNNFTLVLKNYGRNLNELQDGDRLGVMRSGTGALHFYINGVDQGPAASNLPEAVHGILELRGRAHKATIIKTRK